LYLKVSAASPKGKRGEEEEWGVGRRRKGEKRESSPATVPAKKSRAGEIGPGSSGAVAEAEDIW